MALDFRALVGPLDLSDLQTAVEIVYPRSAASNADAAMDELLNRFPDHEPVLLGENDGNWWFRLVWPADPLTFVDPGLPEAARTLYDLRLAEIGGFYEVYSWGGRDVVFSMVHAWALLAGSLAVSRRCGQPLRWIVHVDDHTDMGELPLQPTRTKGTLNDTVFGTNLVLADPDSVVATVRRGTISKGNFLTAYLLGFPGSHVIHVREGVTEAAFKIVPEEMYSSLGGSPLSLMHLRRKPLVCGAGAFRQNSTLPDSLPLTGEGVWLDIDLDYFCNRYDGDSDKLRLQAAAGEHDQVMRRVERFMRMLSSAPWISAIEAVSIAVSPGFFPSDHWAAVIPALRNGVKNLLEMRHS